MTELVIFRGLPASGKTTAARAWVERDPIARARVNRDDLRRMLHGGYVSGEVEHARVWAARDALIDALLRQGVSVACDDTNLPQKVVRGLATVARRAGATVRVRDFTDVPLELCVLRDLDREATVGEGVIRGMHARYLAGRGYPLPLPEPDEEAAVEVYRPDEELPAAWLVDIDGTLALMGDRSPYDWDRVGEDIRCQAVYDLVCALFEDGYAIVLLSGRDAVCRTATEAWLAENAVPYSALLMRPEGDGRKDAVVKAELFREQVAPNWYVRGVLDDRDQVVAMWRSLGLVCAQVAPGAF